MGARRIGREEVYRQATASALRNGGASEFSRQVLASRACLERFRDDPEAVIADLHDILRRLLRIALIPVAALFLLDLGAWATLAFYFSNLPGNALRTAGAALFAQAKEWDPGKGSYKTFSDHWNWGWGWGGGSPETWTRESQERWKDRTDATMNYLKEITKALSTLKRLDEEAVKLNLEPTLEPGKAEEFMKKLDARYKALAADRGRTEKP